MIKKIGTFQNLRLCGAPAVLLVLVILSLAGDVAAEACIAPPRPFVPSDLQTVRDYADIIGRDFELYLRDIQSYFRCLDEERSRAFKEAREVSQEYGRFLELIGR
ncbi:hypothetical protein [Sedimentitalea sp.]|uniref:hypothetical protein n=1 Tax=Sedimentitalea sp. TaxID=2048915 RepID=UPI00329A2BC1